MSLSCTTGQVLTILRANYGRLSSNICNDNKSDDNWSTRCINPTTLTTITKLCGGKTSCLAPVSSKEFGDPCPGTNKYLEIVYTCKHSYTSHSTPDIPDWLKHINMDPPISTVTTTTTTTTTSSTSALVTTTTIQQKTKEYSPD